MAALQDELAGLTAQIDELQKRAPADTKPADPSPEVVALQKVVGEMREKLAKLGASPAPSKAIVGAGATMTKAADTGGDTDADLEERVKAEAERLAKMDPLSRGTELVKMKHRMGGTPLYAALEKRIQDSDKPGA